MTTTTRATVKKTDAEWRAQLDPMQYEVARHAATERAFTGKYWDHCEPTAATTASAAARRCSSRDDQVRRRLRLAELLGAGQQRGRSSAWSTRATAWCASRCAATTAARHLGHVFDDGPAADRRALLHQLGGDRLRSRSLTTLSAPRHETAARLPADHPVLRRLQVRRGQQGLGRRVSRPSISASSSPAAWSGPTKRRCCWPPWS